MTPPNLSGEELRVAVVEALDLPSLSNPVSYPADAHRVMEWLQKEAPWFRLIGSEGEWQCNAFGMPDDEYYPTWTEAVCRAALALAVAREKEKS